MDESFIVQSLRYIKKKDKVNFHCTQDLFSGNLMELGHSYQQMQV